MKLNHYLGDIMKKILIAAIVVVLVILAGLVMLNSGTAKEDTTIEFLSNSSLAEGDSVKFQLTDSKGNPIANQEMIISLDKNGSDEKYSITTDTNGSGSLVLDGVDDGNYKINVSYGGNDQYNPSYSIQALIIGEKVSNDAQENYTQTQSNSSGDSSSSSSSLNYDADLNLYYDANGNIVDPDGQHQMEVGNNYYEVSQRSQQYNPSDFD